MRRCKAVVVHSGRSGLPQCFRFPARTRIVVEVGAAVRADSAVALAVHQVALVQVQVEHAEHLTLVDTLLCADVLLDYDLWVLGFVDRLAAAKVGRALLLVQHDILQLLRVDRLFKILMSVMVIFVLSNGLSVSLF